METTNPISHAKKHLQESRQTDRDKDSIEHLENAVAGLLSLVGPSDIEVQLTSEDESSGDEEDASEEDEDSDAS